MVNKETTKHSPRGKVAPNKVVCSWRIMKTVYLQLRAEAQRQGFSSVPAFINDHFSRFFRGETLKREP